jgi:hypothetical protein
LRTRPEAPELACGRNLTPYHPGGVEKEIIMAEKLEKIEVVSVEDALQMEILVNQALIDVLIDKGILTYDEILKRVEKLKQETGTVLS